MRRDTVDEVFNIINREELSLLVFKGLEKCSSYCKFVSDEAINENKDFYSYI